jgi:hypothetical protein
MKKRFLYIIITFILLTTIELHAQRTPPYPKPNGPPKPELPIDGGLLSLFLAGAALGVYKIKKNNK